MPVVTSERVISGAIGKPYIIEGTPEDGEGGSFAGIAPRGALLISISAAKLFINRGSQASPRWRAVLTQW